MVAASGDTLTFSGQISGTGGLVRGNGGGPGNVALTGINTNWSGGLTLQQVAERTRIGRMHLERVEADRYADLPPSVYLRGILVSLARELKLDATRVSKSYLLLAARSGRPET